MIICETLGDAFKKSVINPQTLPNLTPFISEQRFIKYLNSLKHFLAKSRSKSHLNFSHSPYDHVHKTTPSAGVNPYQLIKSHPDSPASCTFHYLLLLPPPFPHLVRNNKIKEQSFRMYTDIIWRGHNGVARGATKTRRVFMGPSFGQVRFRATLTNWNFAFSRQRFVEICRRRGCLSGLGWELEW